jgi:hypothetical protein
MSSGHPPSTASRRAPTVPATIRDAVGLVALGSVLGFACFVGSERVLVALGAAPNSGLVSAVGGTFGTLPLRALSLAFLRRHPLDVDLRRPILREYGWVVGGFVLLVGAQLAVLAVESLLNPEPATNLAHETAGQNPLFTAGFLFVAAFLLIGPLEELFYRGAVQGLLREATGPPPAILGAALCFGLSHYGTYLLGGSDPLSVGVLLSVVAIAAGGVLLGAIYEHTGSLAVVILIHALVDALGAVTLALGAL